MENDERVTKEIAREMKKKEKIKQRLKNKGKGLLFKPVQIMAPAIFETISQGDIAN